MLLESDSSAVPTGATSAVGVLIAPVYPVGAICAMAAGKQVSQAATNSRVNQGSARPKKK